MAEKLSISYLSSSVLVTNVSHFDSPMSPRPSGTQEPGAIAQWYHMGPGSRRAPARLARGDE